MKNILFASGNKGKLKEVGEIATQFGIVIIDPLQLYNNLVALQDVTKVSTPPPDPEETGSNYFENARIKAEGYYAWANIPALSDDTGLEVSALNNQPGLYTARYAGVKATSEQNISKLLQEMKGVQDRRAVFKCILHFKISEDKYLNTEAELEGEIAHELRGDGGFGYDPVFIVKGYNKTLAELKNEGISFDTHRTRALKELFSKIV